jgi:glycosyltransferase involved in cell wall biosynthesis
MSAATGERLRIAVLGIKRLPAFAGADRVVEHLLAHSSSENEYTIYLEKNGNPTPALTDTHHYVEIAAIGGKYLRAPSYFLLCCLHYLLRGRFDRVHVHNSDFGVFCPLLKLKRGVPVVGSFHGDPATREKWGRIAKAFLRLSEMVFVRTCDTLTSVSSEKAVSGRTVHYIPNGIESRRARVTRRANHAEPTLPSLAGDYIMFACGRLDRTKGLHHLLRAYRGVDSPARLLVVGDFTHDAPYSASIERAAAADARVLLHRALLDRDALRAAISRSIAFVFPSEVEGMSMMLLEALTWAPVVICSDISANIAVVGEDYPFRFTSGDSRALRVALQGATCTKDAEWDPQPLRERIASKFDWGRITLAYERLYAVGAGGV